MATKYVFEDNESVPISNLLSKTYIGKDIYFSGGCNRLLSKAVSIKKMDLRIARALLIKLNRHLS